MREKSCIVLVAVFLLVVASFALTLPIYSSDVQPVGEERRGMRATAAGWVVKTPLPELLEGAAGAVVEDKIYVLKGHNPNVGDTGDVRVYDPTTDSWSYGTPSAIVDAEFYQAGVVSGKIYVIGGRDTFTGNEEYNPLTDTWTSRASMPTGRAGHALAVVGNIICFIGGRDGSAPLSGSVTNVVEAYDPLTDTWITGLAPMPTARSDMAAAVVNGKIYVIGGWDGTNILSTVEAYDPFTDTWSSRATMPTPRADLGAVECSGHIHAIGGINATVNQTSTHEIYDSAADTWSIAEPMPTSRAELVVVNVGGIIYAIGGGIYGVSFDVNEAYSCVAPDAHDVAVTDVQPSKTVVCQGYSMPINVTVENQGDYPETFNVTLYAGGTAVDETGLVGYWKLDEGTGTTAYDSSGNGNNGTLVNGPSWVNGRVGGALSFDGVNDYIVVSHSPSLNITGTTLTLAAWVRPNSFIGGPGGYPQFVLKGDFLASYFLGLTNDGMGFLRGGDGAPGMGGVIITDDALTLNTWNHVAMTFDGTSFRFYINGVHVHNGSHSGNISSVTENLHIGGQPVYSNYFNGTIDEVKVYNRTLSADEIWAEYTRIAIQTVTLESGNSTTITFTWDTTGFAKGNYTISAYAWPVSGETDTTDNTKVEGTIRVTMPGDVKEPFGWVNIKDIVTVAIAFGATPSDPNWNPIADINNDGRITIHDIVTVAIHFGEEDC